jgi:hypothetical protein
MGRDSNPRYLSVHTLSRRAQSTALAPIQDEPEIFRRLPSSFKGFSKGSCPSSKIDRSPGSKQAGERLRRALLLIERLNERLKFGLELALALLDDFQLQLVPMQLDRRVVNVALDFGHLRLALAQRSL